MSSQAIFSKPSITSAAPFPTIMVGNFHIQQKLSHIFSATRAHAKSKIDPSQIFGRDSRVVGLNNIHIIPHVIRPPMGHQLWALLPRSSMHFIENGRSGIGRGCSEESVSDTLCAVRKYNLPFCSALSSVEGGNCYVFYAPDGPKAIVGVNSIALTLLGLEKQDYFTTHQEELDTLIATIDSPSEEAIFRARNMGHFADFPADHLERSAYGKKLMLPLTEEDRSKYFKKAHEWEAKERIARQVIADDLKVPLDKIAFVPQTEFHIDMEMFVAPDGVTVYVDTASSKPEIVAAACDELKRIGRRVILVKGVHTVKGQSINFMNGIFVSTPSGSRYITNGISHDEESERILRLFKNKISFDVDFIDEAQEILTKRRGGIHCLTWEMPNYATPLDIVLSYLVDMPVPAIRMRKHIGEALVVLDTPLGPLPVNALTRRARQKQHAVPDTYAPSSRNKRCVIS